MVSTLITSLLLHVG